MNQLTELLAALAADGADKPALIAAFLDGNPDLGAVEDAALDAFNGVYHEGEAQTPEELAQMEGVVSVLEQVRGMRAEQDAHAAEQAARASELAGIVNAGTQQPTEPAPDGGDSAEGAPVETVAPELVTAAAGQPRLPATGRTTAAQMAATPSGKAWKMFAAADLPRVPAGSEIPDWDVLSEAAERRMRSMLKLGPNVKTSLPIATFQLTRPQGLVLDANSSEQHTRQLVDFAASESRLSGGSLTAAGIWCSPSETIYDLCAPLATTEGLVDLPSITVARGGVRYPQTPNFSDVYAELANGTWTWTDEGPNAPKPCISLPCPDFGECRLDAIGLCVQTDILVNHAWPELVRWWIEQLQVANAHRVNAGILARLEADATAVDFAGTAPAPYQPGGTSSILDILELQVLGMRTKNRMSKRATVEAIFPSWVYGFIRADLAKRTGVDYLGVTDAQIDAWFALRGINAQFVYDWHDIDTTAPVTEWPTTLPVLLYPAGTFVLARQDVISLDAVYDSTLLAQNKFTGLFTEEALCVIKRCHDALFVTIDICADGVTSLPVEYVCPVV